MNTSLKFQQKYFNLLIKEYYCQISNLDKGL